MIAGLPGAGGVVGGTTVTRGPVGGGGGATGSSGSPSGASGAGGRATAAGAGAFLRMTKVGGSAGGGGRWLGSARPSVLLAARLTIGA